jgi:multiple sugar transport system permease protein
MIVPFQIIIPLIIALALYAKPRMARFFQAIIYIPTLFSITAVILTWFFILHPSYGLLNNLFDLQINWFGAQPYAWASIISVTTWWVIGVNMLIYLAALNSIDNSVIESSKIDGALGFRKIRHIYLPLIKFPLMFTILAATTLQFNIYGQPLLLTGGGPTGSTFVLIMYIRDLAFGSGIPIAGIASSMAVLLGLFIGIFSVIQMYVLIKQENN